MYKVLVLSMLMASFYNMIEFNVLLMPLTLTHDKGR